ncbi:MAG: RidA family protein [Bacteroidales bacterium]|jgi:2-iminobutanoate/2-iminopropanoate deaminase|nr:RidA family protein [Bacteroidales bacterium]MBO7305712.1 RidA family protein [Bacteroidales bacterium]MBQ1219696.1 RidA family protein [Bacteroidales bacterium]MBQ1929916.1 RidA family protein [Bacteroidales bacterium]MBQ5593477.1 RidA family protein [Bacteroidales bacterium]
MEKKIIACAKAPKAVGTYSQAVVAGNTIYVSGQLPIDAETGEFVPGGIKEQLHQVFKNLRYILEEAGYSMSDVVKANVFLSDLANFAALNEVYAQYFSEPYPARVAYQVAALPKAALVEIDVIAVK